ncbi:MAG: DNA (cytosine-5-)-methyltransferase [Planctomycetaceae bacterium]|nr:DNA (cytosine-5-)-methyltransferase [Planctomycetaceae bacterium]
MPRPFKFFDFCAGIGAGRLALDRLGGRCVGFSEIDRKAELTYRLFYGEGERNFGDLMKIEPETLPDFDFLIAGFPCQSFSIVGKRAGLRDTRGRIILGLARILRAKRVPYFLLENVKGLVNHNQGRTLRRITQLLDEVGYSVSWRVLNSKDYGVPQNRERVYLVGYRRDLIDQGFEFAWPESQSPASLRKYLVSNDHTYFFADPQRFGTFRRYLQNKYNQNRHSVDDLLTEEQLVIDTRQSDLRLYRGEVPTLRTGRHGILYVRNRKLRELTGEEALLLQGFPKPLASKAQRMLPNTALLSQAGNAMTVNSIQNIGEAMLRPQPSRRPFRLAKFAARDQAALSV